MHRRVDHRMSLLVAATFLSRSLFLDQRHEKEKKDRQREKERKTREEKKIVHPIADARGRGKFCRLACTSLYGAGGHDWSKTEIEQIWRKEIRSAQCTYIKFCLTNKKERRNPYVYFMYDVKYLFIFFSIDTG
jgi:hypothetical protein